MKGSSNLLVVTGPSNSGKDTLRNQLETLIEQTKYLTNVNIIRMHTNRPARDGEVHGKDYFFDFLDKFHADMTLTYHMYRSESGSDWYYWVNKEDLNPDPDVLNVLFIGIYELFHLDKRLQKGELDLNLWRLWKVCLYAEEADRLERAIKRSSREPEGIREVIRRANADLHDYSVEMLQKVGIGLKDYILSDTNAFLNLLLHIDQIQYEISKSYLLGKLHDEKNKQPGRTEEE